MQSLTITLDLTRLVNAPITMLVGGAIALLLRRIAFEHGPVQEVTGRNEESFTALTKLCFVFVLLMIPVAAIACNLFDYAVGGDHLMAPSMLAWAGTFLAVPVLVQNISKIRSQNGVTQNPRSFAHA